MPDPVYSPCAALSTGDWSARIVEGPHFERWDRTSPTLVVSGRVTVPSPGYRVVLEPGPVIDLKPPVQQVILRTTPPEGGGESGPVELEVSGSMGWHRGPETVSVRCGDGIVAEIGRIVDSRPTTPTG